MLKIVQNSLKKSRHCNPLTSNVTRCTSSNQSKASESEEQDKLFRMIKLECRANDMGVLNSYKTFAMEAAKHLGIQVDKVESPRPVFEKRILLRSAHVHKKHREHYEWRTYFKILTLKYLTGSTADTYLEYVERNLPEGVAMIVHKHEIQPLPKHVLKAPS